MANRWGNNGNSDRLYFLGLENREDGDGSHEILKDACFLNNLDSILKSRDITLPTKVCLVKTMVFSNSHLWMWELDYEESWSPKNWCFSTVVMEKTLEHCLDCKEIQPVNPNGSQSWIFIGRTDAEAETPILWLLDVKNWLLGKDPDAGKDWRQEEKGMTEDEIVGCHHWLDGYDFEEALRVGHGQGSLVCCSPWGRKELEMTVTELNWIYICVCVYILCIYSIYYIY